MSWLINGCLMVFNLFVNGFLIDLCLLFVLLLMCKDIVVIGLNYYKVVEWLRKCFFNCLLCFSIGFRVFLNFFKEICIVVSGLTNGS